MGQLSASILTQQGSKLLVLWEYLLSPLLFAYVMRWVLLLSPELLVPVKLLLSLRILLADQVLRWFCNQSEFQRELLANNVQIKLPLSSPSLNFPLLPCEAMLLLFFFLFSQACF